MAGKAPFIRDDPESLSSDAFGHRDYTDALVSILEDESPPPTIGLFGPWGVGKSTIIGGVQKALLNKNVGFVYLDTWRYEGDPLRRQFLIEAAKQLDKAGELKASYSLTKELNELHIDRQEITESLGVSLARLSKAALVGAIFGVVAVVLLLTGVFEDVLSGNFGTGLLASVAAFVIGTFAGLLSQAIIVRPTTVTHRALQDPDRFAEKFAALLNALRAPRLVVAIDNLDRCSPEKAVEMLGTIKTYLEPVVAGELFPRSDANEAVDKEVIFLIAVDDAALRRHLIAQEEARSARHGNLEVSRYVDEYLAKFFSARLPIREILLDDMRGFVEAHLLPLAAARDLDKDQSAALVSLVAGALRRNPRGVKQFRNDLESRLRLLEEREEAKQGHRGIDPPVSGEVVMVAKLALIESEWPEAFTQLQDDPRMLERWTTEAAVSTEVDWSVGGNGERDQDGTIGVTASMSEQRAFGDFIRLSASTHSEHLRAMLNLKQSQVEVELPGFSEFREALVNGDRAAIEAVLDGTNAAQRGKLAARVPEFLRAEIKRGYIDYSRVIVEGMMAIEAFDPFLDSRRRTLTIAVETPAVRSQLLSIDAALVMRNASLLDPPVRQALFEPFLERLLNSQNSDHVRLPFAEALGPHAPDLSREQKQRVTEALSGELKGSFDLYLPLVRAEPKLLPLAAANEALESLRKPSGAQPAPDAPLPLTKAPMPLEVLELGLRDPSINLEVGVLELVASVIPASASQESVLETELPVYLRFLEPLETRRDEVWSKLSRALEAVWGMVPTGLWAEAVTLAAIAVERAEEGTSEAVSQAITERIFEDPEQGLRLANEVDIPSLQLQTSFVVRLTSLAGEPDHWHAACDALERIDSDEFPQRLANALNSLLAGGHINEVEAMLKAYTEIFELHQEMLASAVTPVLLAQVEGGQTIPPSLLARLSESLSDDQLGQLASAYVARLAGPEGSAIPELFDQLREWGADRLRMSAAHKVISQMGEDPDPALAPQIAVACRQVDQLPPADQRLLAAGLSVRIRAHLDQALQIAGNVATIRKITAEAANELVEALIDAETAIPEEGTRRQLLNAANAIRGRRNSLAAKALRKRLDALAESDNDFNTELASQLLPLLEG